MRHLGVVFVMQLLPKKLEIMNLLEQGFASRIGFRQCTMLVCLLLLVSCLVDIALNPLCKLRGLGTTTQKSTGELISTKVDTDDGSPPIKPCGLSVMNGKMVVLVSHELSLSGGPLLLMELGSVLQRCGANVFWVTGNKKDTSSNAMVLSLEMKLLNHGLQILAPRGMRTVAALTTADLVILNTAVAGKWFDTILNVEAKNVLTKTLWWIHELRGHYFAMEYVKHLPKVAGIIIDSHSAAEYWRTRFRDRLRITLPKMYVVHLGNSQQLMVAAENVVARTTLRQRLRQMIGIHDNDVVFTMINSVSRGKGQGLFLRAFVEGVNLIKQINVQEEKTLVRVHALLVGSDWAATSYELMLRSFVKDNDLESIVHFVNKSMDVVSYLAASDVLIQNSQGRGECFGRITIEAMAFQLPVLGTSAGGTLEILLNGSTGRLHPVGKEGLHILAHNMRDLTLDKSLRIEMGRRGYDRVKQHFMEHHMCKRLDLVLRMVLSKLHHDHGI